MANEKRLPTGYGLYKSLMERRGVKSYLTPSAFGKVGALRAYEALLPPGKKGVVPKIRERYRRTGGVSGLF